MLICFSKYLLNNFFKFIFGFLVRVIWYDLMCLFFFSDGYGDFIDVWNLRIVFLIVYLSINYFILLF